MRAGGRLQVQGAYFPITMPETGLWKGHDYQVRATGLEWDHLALALPQVKSHSAVTRQDRLKEIKRSWEARLGIKC